MDTSGVTKIRKKIRTVFARNPNNSFSLQSGWQRRWRHGSQNSVPNRHKTVLDSLVVGRGISRRRPAFSCAPSRLEACAAVGSAARIDDPPQGDRQMYRPARHGRITEASPAAPVHPRAGLFTAIVPGRASRIGLQADLEPLRTRLKRWHEIPPDNGRKAFYPVPGRWLG